VGRTTMTVMRASNAGWAVAILLLIFLCIKWLHQEKIDEATYTLIDAPKTRVDPIHVATFDSGSDPVFNKINCDTARELFQKWANEGTDDDHYQCEKGRLRP
jgi:hypothetical protein